jgi:hypothetical protein
LRQDPAVAAAAARHDARRRPSWTWMAAAAVLLLAVGGGLWTVSSLVRKTPAGTAASTEATSPEALVQSIESELQLAAEHYENAIGKLEQVAAAGDSPLDPDMMATLKQSLAVIDAAIDESRTALRAEPGSQVAQENLFEAFRRKIVLLQDTIALMNEMRKGDEAGAARVAGELSKG